MPGSTICVTARASLKKRWTISSCTETSGKSILIAAVRPSSVCSARYTAPMPPSPSFPRTRYAPTIAPSTSITPTPVALAAPPATPFRSAGLSASRGETRARRERDLSRSHDPSARRSPTPSLSTSRFPCGVAVRHRDDRIDPCRRRIERRHEHELVTARGLPLLACADADLFDGLETVRDERGAQHGETLLALSREVFDHVVGVRLDPRRPPEPRLETHGVAVRPEAEPLREAARGRERLRPITVRVCRTVTTRLGLEAVRAGLVGLHDLPLGQSVEREQHVVGCCVGENGRCDLGPGLEK